MFLIVKDEDQDSEWKSTMILTNHDLDDFAKNYNLLYFLKNHHHHHDHHHHHHPWRRVPGPARDDDGDDDHDDGDDFFRKYRKLCFLAK